MVETGKIILYGWAGFDDDYIPWSAKENTEDGVFWLDEKRISTIQLSSDSFSDTNENIMSAAAIEDRYAQIIHSHDDEYYTENEVDNLLSGKSNTGHTHNDLYYTETEVDNLLSDKSDTGHTHDGRYYTESETDNLLSSKSDTTHNHNDVYYTESEVDNLLNDKSDITHDHDGVYAPISHSHNDVYYTETEVDNLLSDKSDTGHTHDDRYYTESEVDNALALKSDTTHNHNSLYYTESEVDNLLNGKSDTTHNHDSAYLKLTGGTLSGNLDVNGTGEFNYITVGKEIAQGIRFGTQGCISSRNNTSYLYVRTYNDSAYMGLACGAIYAKGHINMNGYEVQNCYKLKGNSHLYIEPPSGYDINLNAGDDIYMRAAGTGGYNYLVFNGSYRGLMNGTRFCSYTHKDWDLGGSSNGWDEVYYDNLHNIGPVHLNLPSEKIYNDFKKMKFQPANPTLPNATKSYGDPELDLTDFPDYITDRDAQTKQWYRKYREALADKLEKHDRKTLGRIPLRKKEYLDLIDSCVLDYQIPEEYQEVWEKRPQNKHPQELGVNPDNWLQALTIAFQQSQLKIEELEEKVKKLENELGI